MQGYLGVWGVLAYGCKGLSLEGEGGWAARKG